MKQPSENSLIEALKQNWYHARHQELQRQQQLYVFVAVVGGIVTFVLSKHVSLNSTLMQFWLVFLFVMAFSLLTSWSTTKWNLEFRNHVAEIQWISEELGLVGSISDERKQKIANCKHLDGEHRKRILSDAMFQGYMGLPLPLPRRVHQSFDHLMDLVLLGSSFAFLSGLLLAIFSFVISNLGSTFFSSSSISVLGIPLSRVVAYAAGAVFSLFLLRRNMKTRKRMEANATKLLDTREPDEIGLRYRGYKPFYGKDPEKLSEEDMEYYK